MDSLVGDGANAKQNVPLSSTGIKTFLAGMVRIRPPISKNDTFWPTVSFLLMSGPILTIPATNIFIQVDERGTFRFAFAPSPTGLSIIGNIEQEGLQISIDGSNGFVHFGRNIC
ncbi:PREDICTED: protein ASPARTIC PROTEASE IN GUARD CELL 2-like [Ipomoea nil]|uniref:protein ASPARTIC PROTEASE IN GUARD CELL 2-like n=1 Tax=Ipomoea nil TaxID=35883 RepID=UPI000901699E|nr:PREDICTED: protein ASPARTIC PROTEASE IN GUARD CELL 2-like [Ipomoea nil]